MKLSLKLMIAVTLCALNLSVGWAQRQYPGSPGLPAVSYTHLIRNAGILLKTTLPEWG